MTVLTVFVICIAMGFASIAIVAIDLKMQSIRHNRKMRAIDRRMGNRGRARYTYL